MRLLPPKDTLFGQKTILEPKEITSPFGVDASDLVALIPFVGTTLADSLRAMHTREIRKILTPEEFDRYTKWDKMYPDTFALLRSRL